MSSIASLRDDSDSPPSPMNVEEALSRLAGDRDLLRAIIEIFLEDAPPLYEKVRQAVMRNDLPTLHRAAHSLKGLAATLSAHDMAAAASRLEHMASARSMPDGAAAVGELEQRLRELTDAAKRFLKNPG
ncbi:Hpt domain-containing protein [Lacipirellula sp.]|uniref:Hpt domain-containing protein n=1 Tax=Lacipirellula sp. TaxID=2691419 RepID=UPI003D09C43F